MRILDARKANPSTGGPSFSIKNRVTRAVWIVVWLALAAWTPRQFRSWRCFLLRLFGARVSPNGDVRGSARVWLPSNLILRDGAVVGPGVNCYNMELIEIGEDALVSQGAFLCAGTHDFEDPHFQLIARPIVIGANSWIATEVFIGPGSRVGEGTVVGARAVVFGDLEDWAIYVGNPAKRIRSRKVRPL